MSVSILRTAATRREAAHFGQLQLTELRTHAKRIDLATANREALDRQRVEHFVRQDHAAKRHCGQGIEPPHARQEVRDDLLEGLALAFAQVRAEIENPVFGRQRALPFEFGQQLRSHRARTRPQFEQARFRPQCLQHLGALQRQAAAEDRGDLGRRDEIAPRTELARPGTVIAEAGLVERPLHVPVKADPAALGYDFRTDALRECCAVRRFVGSQLGQVQGNGHRWPNPFSRTARCDCGILLSGTRSEGLRRALPPTTLHRCANP